MSLRDLFVVCVVFGSLPFILARPHLGIVMWSWMGYMNPHRLAWGFARELPLAQIVAITTLASFLFSREPKSLPKTREVAVLLLFVIWMAITTFFADQPHLAVLQLEKVLKIQLMTFLTMMVMGSKERLNLLIWTIALSLGFYGVKGGIFTITTGGGYHVLGPLGTFIGGNNEIGLALIMAVPLMRYLQLNTERIWVRHGLTAAMFLTGVSILGTQSRGAFVGVVAMVCFLWLKGRRKILLGALLAIAIPVSLSFMAQSWHDRIDSIRNYEQDGSVQGRFEAWRFHFETAVKNPLVGGGFEARKGRARDAHSIYFEAMGEHGFVGFTLFLLLMVLTWRTGNLLIRAGKAYPELKWSADLAAMVQVSIVGYATSGAFLGLAYFDLYYHLVAIMVLAKLIVTERLMAESHKEEVVPSGASHSLEAMREARVCR